jgi:hypothetical protein
MRRLRIENCLQTLSKNEFSKGQQLSFDIPCTIEVKSLILQRM